MQLELQLLDGNSSSEKRLHFLAAVKLDGHKAPRRVVEVTIQCKWSRNNYAPKSS